MPGIFPSLSSASYALQTHSRSVEQTGKNIANINNPNYSRQRIVTGSVGAFNTSSGVESGPLQAIGVVQIRDVYIDRQMLSELSYQSSLETQDFRLRQALANFGDTVDRSEDATFVDDVAQLGGGLRGAMDKFFDSFESLAARPNDATTRQVVFQSAEAMVDSFNRIDNRFDIMQDELDKQISVELTSLNQRISELHGINQEIGRLELGQPGSALDLRDQRQQLLEEISEYVLVESVESAEYNGQVSLSMRNEDGDMISILEPMVAPREIYFDATARTFRLTGSGETFDIESGRLPAILEVSDTYVAEIRSQLDLMANNLATEVNELYYQAFAAAGADPAVPEISFFQQPTPPPSISGIASTVTAASLALYSEPSDVSVTDYVPLTANSLRTTTSEFSGANELALAIADVATQNLAGLGSLNLSDFASRSIASLGQEIEQVQSRMEVQQDVVSLLEARRGEVAGVSMDEEVSQMVQYQRAFQASSRYFNVLSEMLETLINSLGR